MKKILVIIPQRGIGDLIYHLPLLRSLYESYNQKLFILSNKVNHAKEVYKYETFYEEIIYFENTRFPIFKTIKTIINFKNLINRFNVDQLILTGSPRRLIIPVLLSNIKDKVRIQLVHRNVAGNSQYDGCFAIKTVYDCKSRYQLDATRISLEYSNNSFTHSLAYSKSATDRDDFALGNRAFGSNGEIKRIEYISSARNLVGFDLVFGIDLEQEINGSLDRENKAIYFEYISDFSDSFFLTAGLRRDENADFGNHNSSRLTGAYLIKRGNSNIKLKASYGSGFRAPSLFEVSYNVGPFSFPPASIAQLSEEISTGFEYGIEYLSQNMQLELVRFNQEVENAIYFDLSGFSGYLQDTGNSISKGIEISGSIIASETISLNANYTFNATERPNGLQRIRRPEKLANLGISFVSSSERLRINAFYRISKESVDELFGSPINLDDFEVLDISAAYRLSANVELFARLENTLDEEYREILDFNAPDRASYIGIRLSF